MNEGLPAFRLERAGVYVLLDDVVAQLLTVADDYEQAGNPSAALSLRAVAEIWQVEEDSSPETPSPNEPGDSLVAVFSDGAANRVEVFPDSPDAPRPRWHARTVDNEGQILKVTNGSFDQDYVIKDANERWPDLDVHLLVSADQDTIWEETDPGGFRSAGSGRRRPSPNRIGLTA